MERARSVVVVLRHRSVLDDETDFDKTATGMKYSKREAIAVRRSGDAGVWSREQFCSRLAARAYAFAGFDLVPNADFAALRT